MSVPGAVRVLVNVSRGKLPSRQTIKEAQAVAEGFLSEKPKAKPVKKKKADK